MYECTYCIKIKKCKKSGIRPPNLSIVLSLYKKNVSLTSLNVECCEVQARLGNIALLEKMICHLALTQSKNLVFTKNGSNLRKKFCY